MKGFLSDGIRDSLVIVGILLGIVQTVLALQAYRVKEPRRVLPRISAAKYFRPIPWRSIFLGESIFKPFVFAFGVTSVLLAVIVLTGTLFDEYGHFRILPGLVVMANVGLSVLLGYQLINGEERERSNARVLMWCCALVILEIVIVLGQNDSPSKVMVVVGSVLMGPTVIAGLILLGFGGFFVMFGIVHLVESIKDNRSR